METITQYLSRIDELTLRERVIVMGGILLLLFLGWYTYLMEPLIKEEKGLQAQLTSKRNRLQELNDQFGQMADRQNMDPNESKREKVSALRRQIEQSKQELKSTAANLVPPEDMPDILRLVLNKSQGLSLSRLTGLGSTPLIVAAGNAGRNNKQQGSADDNLASAFKHGMQIEFTGGFHETLEYIRTLEGLGWGFFWDSIDYKVTEYPEAVITITLYTLSLSSNWISI